MNDKTDTRYPPIPADDLNRKLVVADPDDAGLPHFSLARGSYTVLLTGADTGGRYCLIDMLVPPGGGPPPHRHDFDEMFSVLEGEIELTFRGKAQRAGAGVTVNIPANAMHNFRNVSDRPAHLLCMCVPPGQDEYFLAIADKVESRNAPAPALTADEMAARRQNALALAAKYRGRSFRKLTFIVGPSSRARLARRI